jgi:hypothetical protein
MIDGLKVAFPLPASSEAHNLFTLSSDLKKLRPSLFAPTRRIITGSLPPGKVFSGSYIF